MGGNSQITWAGGLAGYIETMENLALSKVMAEQVTGFQYTGY